MLVLRAIVFGSICLSAADAQELPLLAPTLVVTPTRTPTPFSEALPSTLRVERAAFEQAAQGDVLDVLRLQGGIEATHTGGLGTLGATFLRGADADHVLVLFDGVRLNSATSGTAPLEHVLPNAVGHAEVVRGNVSSLYGSSAIGGVVQLFPNAACGATPSWGANLGIGSRALRRFGAEVSAQWNDTCANASLGGVWSDGFSAVRADRLPTPSFALADGDDDAYRNLSLSARLAHRFAPGHDVSLSLLHADAESDYDGSFSNQGRTKLSVFALNSAHLLSEAWLTRFTLGQTIDDLTDRLDGQFADRFKAENRQFTWQNELTLWSGHKSVLGLEWLQQTARQEQAFDPSLDYERSKRTIKSGFVEHIARIGDVLGSASLRQDNYSDVGGKRTGRFDLGYVLNDAWRVNASVSNAFRAPTFNDLYYPFFGNPALKPERSRSIEAGVRYFGTRQRFAATAFRTKVSELIVFDFITNKPQNIDRSRVTGVEFDYALQLGATRLNANWTLQDPQDQTSNQRLTRRANWHGSVRVSQQLERLSFDAALRVSGARHDSDFNTFARQRLGGYSVLDLAAHYSLTPRTRLSLSIENVLDKDYELASGYNVTPRSVLLSLSHHTGK